MKKSLGILGMFAALFVAMRAMSVDDFYSAAAGVGIFLIFSYQQIGRKTERDD